MIKIKITTSLVALLMAACFSAYSQDQSAAIQQKLVSEFALTQPTAAMDDIVTAGSVIVLKTGNVVMAPTTSTSLCQNTYKDGKISQNALCRANKARKMWGQIPVLGASAPSTGLDTRTFVPGEKMWITKIDVQPTFIDIGLFTDAYNDVRYKADLKFPFPKGWTPTVDQADKLVGAVFSVAPTDNASGGQQQGAAGGQQAAGAPQQTSAPPPPAGPAPESAPAPIAPPPPPPADPKTIALKQTIAEVVGNFGEPVKIINLGSKQIYVYKDMKVTFVGGKVTDVQ